MCAVNKCGVSCVKVTPRLGAHAFSYEGNSRKDSGIISPRTQSLASRKCLKASPLPRASFTPHVLSVINTRVTSQKPFWTALEIFLESTAYSCCSAPLTGTLLSVCLYLQIHSVHVFIFSYIHNTSGVWAHSNSLRHLCTSVCLSIHLQICLAVSP